MKNEVKNMVEKENFIVLPKGVADKVEKIDTNRKMTGHYSAGEVYVVLDNAKSSGTPMCGFSMKYLKEIFRELGDDDAELLVYSSTSPMATPCIIESKKKGIVVALAPRVELV